MNKLISLYCWLFGHVPDYSGQIFDADADECDRGWRTPCSRCGKWDIDYHELVTGSRSHKAKMFFVYWLYRRWWPELCRDCGKRRGDHSGCLPF